MGRFEENRKDRTKAVLRRDQKPDTGGQTKRSKRVPSHNPTTTPPIDMKKYQNDQLQAGAHRRAPYSSLRQKNQTLRHSTSPRGGGSSAPPLHQDTEGSTHSSSNLILMTLTVSQRAVSSSWGTGGPRQMGQTLERPLKLQ